MSTGSFFHLLNSPAGQVPAVNYLQTMKWLIINFRYDILFTTGKFYIFVLLNMFVGQIFLAIFMENWLLRNQHMMAHLTGGKWRPSVCPRRFLSRYRCERFKAFSHLNCSLSRLKIHAFCVLSYNSVLFGKLWNVSISFFKMRSKIRHRNLSFFLLSLSLKKNDSYYCHKRGD